jgi:hypothetical protein
MDGDPGHKWLREVLQATARERLETPVGETASNVTPFARVASAGPRGRKPPPHPGSV